MSTPKNFFKKIIIFICIIAIVSLPLVLFDFLRDSSIKKEEMQPIQELNQQEIATSSVPLGSVSTSTDNKPSSSIDSNESTFFEVRVGPVTRRESKTTIINNDPVATITHDFKYGTKIVYTTKDASKTYFALYTETEGQECVYLNYLDTKKIQYVNTQLQYCPGSDGSPISEDAKKEVLPFVVQYGKFDSQKIYALNLETGKEVVIYALQDSKESLIASCVEGMYDFMYIPEIRGLGGKQIIVGVYKKTVDSTTRCLKEERYPKIREDTIDLSIY